MKRIVQVALSFIFIASQVVCSFAQTNATLFKVTSVSPSFVREGDKPFFQFLLSNSTKFDWTGTGAVDDVVLSSCIYKNDLNRRSLTVFHVQRRLIELGLLEDGSVKAGYYGDLTKAAVLKFQEANSIAGDGLMNADTFVALFEGDPNVRVVLN